MAPSSHGRQFHVALTPHAALNDELDDGHDDGDGNDDDDQQMNDGGISDSTSLASSSFAHQFSPSTPSTSFENSSSSHPALAPTIEAARKKEQRRSFSVRVLHLPKDFTSLVRSNSTSGSRRPPTKPSEGNDYVFMPPPSAPAAMFAHQQLPTDDRDHDRDRRPRKSESKIYAFLHRARSGSRSRSHTRPVSPSASSPPTASPSPAHVDPVSHAKSPSASTAASKSTSSAEKPSTRSPSRPLSSTNTHSTITSLPPTLSRRPRHARAGLVLPSEGGNPEDDGRGHRTDNAYGHGAERGPEDSNGDRHDGSHNVEFAPKPTYDTGANASNTGSTRRKLLQQFFTPSHSRRSSSDPIPVPTVSRQPSLTRQTSASTSRAVSPNADSGHSNGNNGSSRPAAEPARGRGRRPNRFWGGHRKSASAEVPVPVPIPVPTSHDTSLLRGPPSHSPLRPDSFAHTPSTPPRRPNPNSNPSTAPSTPPPPAYTVDLASPQPRKHVPVIMHTPATPLRDDPVRAATSPPSLHSVHSTGKSRLGAPEPRLRAAAALDRDAEREWELGRTARERSRSKESSMAGSLPKEQGLAARLSPRMWARGLERTASGSGGRRDKGKEKERDTSRVRGPTIERASSRARAIRPPVLQNGHSTVNVNASLSTPAYATSVPPSPNYSQSHAVKKTRHGSFDFERPVMVQPSPHHAGAPRAHVKKVHLPPPAPLTSSSHATATATATGTGAGSWGRRTATGMAKRPQLGGAGLAHGAFAFEPAVSTSTSGSVVSERSVAAGGSTSSRTGTAKARAVTGDTVLAPGDRGKRPAARGRSLDLGIGLAWAPTKVRQEAVLPSFRGPSARGYAHPGTADAMEALRGILGEPAFATLTKYVRRYDARAISLDALVNRTEKLLNALPINARERREMLDRFVRGVRHA
ncbi:hypothetical protein PLICRDRAFT_169624 [Plicaturopsis crispa FD-325 SS-3]|nr:hypothetical protein PLICRDRAFT_169624 [Plicaturopsis crispa FD-325 SS-3]